MLLFDFSSKEHLMSKRSKHKQLVTTLFDHMQTVLRLIDIDYCNALQLCWDKSTTLRYISITIIISDINYFHCQKIVELLKDTDSGKKNMFGQYSSQKMKVSQ